MIVMIRIAGRINVNEAIEATLGRMRMKRKFTCSLAYETPENLGMIKKVGYFIAYGKISKEMLAKLLEKRGRLIGNKKIGKTQAEKLAAEIIDSKIQKNLKEYGIKPFFCLQPALKGFKDTKRMFPKGDLGNHGDKINLLLERML